MLGELLDRDDVVEELQIRSRFGFMAYHGGTLEKATDPIAREAAELAGASYYGVLQSHPEPTHITSKELLPDQSASLSEFLDHVDVVITVHGYGRKHLFHSVLLGGRNRALASHIGAHARFALPRYRFEDNLAQIPAELAGQHELNPVNRPRQAGVQMELPPTIRWNRDEWGWSDNDGIGRATQVNTLIHVLAGAARAWPTEWPRTNGVRSEPDLTPLNHGG